MARLVQLTLLAAGIASTDGAKATVLQVEEAPHKPFVPWGGKASGMAAGSTEPWVEMIKHTDILKTSEQKCICELGQYFNYKEQKCVPKEDVGFDCSSFPLKHHGVICKDGYTCKGASPQCLKCEHGDYCTSGSTRHETGCLKENHMSGNACVTVEVTVPSFTDRETVRVKESYEASNTQKVSSSATATAVHTATETDLARGKGEADATESVEVLEKGKSKAQMEVVTKGGSSTDTNNVDAEGISVAKGSGSSSAHADGEGRRYGTSIATEERTATSEVSMDYTANAKKSSSAEETAEVTVTGKSQGSACVSHKEAEKIARIGKKIKEIVVASQIQHVGLRTAYERAVALATKRAYKKGKDDAKKGAKDEAERKAASNARGTAKALADQEAYDKARVDGQKAADAKAQNDAQSEAEAKAKAAAESSARKKARQTAQKYADADAKEDARRKASAKAKARATQKASGRARDTAESEAYINAQNTAANSAEAQAREEARAEQVRRSNLRKQKAQQEYEAKVQNAREEQRATQRQGKAQKMDGQGDSEALAKISQPGGILRAY
eukprot:TRINITY_DN1998_c0_g1_i3.p1 TRINITY_DN1998_c0_g1~~TRINITY_DN1998_c0_g1_i3.p1  ORF type:complete len:559 (-),score=175.54 TRINITY_DN1998_c0_g1_i3:60-1736(-)